MIIVPLNLQLAYSLADNIDERFRYEILNLKSVLSLREWARGRVRHGGYALVDGGAKIIGGVAGGALWIAGARGWKRYVKSMLRCFAIVREEYQRLECKCYTDNLPARRLVERLGFTMTNHVTGLTRDDRALIEYRMVPQ